MKNLEPRNRYKLLTGVVVPRPIALVTTLDLEGRVNAAPYSFFNAIGSDPPIVALGPGKTKHTFHNIRTTQEFVVNLVSEKDVNALDAWFTAVKSSGLPDLMSFAVGLEREREPLEAAISEVWSNGRAEGHVNRLKLIKRQAYGQAGFELLRKRVLAA